MFIISYIYCATNCIYVAAPDTAVSILLILRGKSINTIDIA